METAVDAVPLAEGGRETVTLYNKVRERERDLSEYYTFSRVSRRAEREGAVA